MVAPLRESPCMLQNRLIQYLVVTALLFGIADLALNFYTGTYGAIKMRADADKAKSDASIAAANAKAKPIQSKPKSTVRSAALTENRNA